MLQASICSRTEACRWGLTGLLCWERKCSRTSQLVIKPLSLLHDAASEDMGEGTLLLLTVGYPLQTDCLIPASVTLSHLLHQESSLYLTLKPRAVCTAQLNPPSPVHVSSLPVAATALGVFVVLCSAQSLIVNLGSLIVCSTDAEPISLEYN